MATSGQLIEVVARYFGIRAATVAQFDRLLAQNGLRSKGGRGLSAASMTSRDAASLMIIIAGTQHLGPSIKDALESYEYFARMKFSPYELPDDWVKGLAKGRKDIEKRLGQKLPKDGTVQELRDKFSSFASLGDQHCFLDALSGLIEAVKKSEIEYDRDYEKCARVFVTLHGDGRTNLSIAPRSGPRWDLVYRSSQRFRGIDLYWQRGFSIRSIGAVARVLGSP